nr:unnamed protein product [Callosobruchus analis]CAI5851916.1 unnamed protein product [Callosobruchus analis]
MEYYLVDRYQCVNVENNMSDFKKSRLWNPQASVLGPILFNIYLADLHQQATVIVYKSDTWENLKTTAENDLKSLKMWFAHRLLTVSFNNFFVPFSANSISLPKYKQLNIYERRNQILSMSIAGTIKYLGVYLDKHLRWDVHVTYIVKKNKNSVVYI